ncbi:SHIRT domain-containing protein [Alloscardovia omnicolens]|uniref:SHIRT domain-containing protein n=1 Tax=Alloscardovia omnicolens TaxID=419015 RepID=UPI003A6EA9BC
MKKSKALVSLLISVAMISLSPGVAMAADSTPADNTVNVENTVNPDNNTPDNTASTNSSDEANTETENSLNTSDSSDHADSSATNRSADAADAVETPASNEANATGTYEATVSFIGQWTNESRTKTDTTKDFHNPTDKLGSPAANAGLFRSIAKTFLGWSDQPQDAKGKLPEGARLFSAEDTVATAFPQGIPQDAKLYGVYYSLNEQNTAWPGDQFSMGLALLSGMSKISQAVNENTVTINPDSAQSTVITPESVLPDTDNVSATFGTDDQNRKTSTIDDLWLEKNNTHGNEVALSSYFTMNPYIAMLVYRNPHVGYVGPVLTGDYARLKGDTDSFSTEMKPTDAKNYTHVDLKVDLDNRLTVPERLHLEFSGYSWRPLYVLNDKGEALNIFNPADDSSLGNDKNAFNSLVSNSSPQVNFGVEPAGNKTLIIRCILRLGDAEKITEDKVTPQDGKSIAETITSNMTLRTLGSKEISAQRSDLSVDALAGRVVSIDNNLAKQLADNKDHVQVTGSVYGSAVADAGKIGSGWLSFNSRNVAEITPTLANILNLGYVRRNVTYRFDSIPSGQKLPEDVMKQLPKNFAMDKIVQSAPHSKPSNPKVRDGKGTWEFVDWYRDTTEEKNLLTTDSSELNVAELTADPVFIGLWKYYEVPGNPPAVEDKPQLEIPVEPNEPQQPAKEQQVKTSSHASELPKTGDFSGVLIISMVALSVILCSIALVLRYKTKL